MLVLLALYVVAIKCDMDYNLTEKAAVQNETGLVYQLRRRLMKDNYDYETQESEEFPALHQHDNNAANDKNVDNLESYHDSNGDDNSKDLSHDEHIKNLFVPRALDDMDTGKSHGISKKDLLYYLDDERLGSLKRQANNEVFDDDQYTDEANDTDNKTTTRKAKYKFFKVRNKNQNRRSGTKYQRFIEEDGADGIAVMALDDGPMPQFRLPHSRRQYMHDHGFTKEEFTDLSNDVTGIINGSNLT